MKDVLKMIRFDYIAVRPLTVPYVAGFVAVSLALSLFGIPLGVFCFAALAAIFVPVQELANSDSGKIYGILPVRRDAVIRAAFLEMIVPLFAGELLSLLLLLISNSSTLYRVLPKAVGDIIERSFNFSNDSEITFGGLCIILILTTAYLCILAAYLEMRSEIKGRENDIKNLLISISLTAAVIAVIAVLANKRMIPPVQSWLIPQTTAGKWLLAVTANVIAAGLGILFCEITVKKTADREI